MLSAYPFVTILPSADLDRSRAFYVDRLGLRLVMQDESDLRVEAGQGSLLMIYHRPGGSPAAHTVGGFVVPDLRAMARQLIAAGIQPEHYDFPGLRTDELGIARTGDHLTLWLLDPDGNILAVMQML